MFFEDFLGKGDFFFRFLVSSLMQDILEWESKDSKLFGKLFKVVILDSDVASVVNKRETLIENYS